MIAAHELGERAVAVTAVSPSIAAAEVRKAAALAEAFGFRHVTLNSNEFNDPRYLENGPDRCFWCKSALFEMLNGYAKENGFACVLDGSNADDRSDYRPGHQAAIELGVHSPLMELGFSKAEIRAVARDIGLPNWNKPAKACLASRLPYGTPVNGKILRTVETAELHVEELGIEQVRVRHHGDIARIEVEPAAFQKILAAREEIMQKLRDLGFKYVTLDLQGYKTGSLNQVLRDEYDKRDPTTLALK